MPSLDDRITSLSAAVSGLARLEFGDVDGHPFHGNQWTGGEGGGGTATKEREPVEGKDFLSVAKNLPGANTEIERDMRKVLDQISRGEKTIVPQPKLATLVQEMKEKVDEIKAVRAVQKAAGVPDDKLQKIPNMDLCGVSVPGTNYFCAENLGVARVNMPQLSVSADKLPDGVPAKEFPVNQFGEVNLAEHFAEHLESQGIKITDTAIRSGDLRASQSELDGGKIARNMGLIEDGKMDRAIFVSNDNYVLDGHHQWAAQLAVDTIKGDANSHPMNVRVIDMPMRELLPLTLGYTRGMGVPGAAVHASAVELGDIDGHDFHGNQWTGGVGVLDRPDAGTANRIAGQALRMKYVPRSEHDTQRVANTPTGASKVLDHLKTNARPLGPEALAAISKGDRIGVVVNGEAHPAIALTSYSPHEDLVSVRYFPADRQVPEAVSDKVPMSVVGLAGVKAGDIYSAADIIGADLPRNLDPAHPFPHGAGDTMQHRWGTIAASADWCGCAEEWIVFTDNTATPLELKEGTEMEVTETVELTTCTKCGGQVGDGNKTCQNCGGATTASIAERVSELEFSVLALAELEFGKMPPQFAKNAQKKKDAAAKGKDGEKKDNKPPWLKKKVESATEAEEVAELGDSEGHPFHGNQYSDGSGGSDRPSGYSPKLADAHASVKYWKEKHNESLRSHAEPSTSRTPAVARNSREMRSINSQKLRTAEHALRETVKSMPEPDRQAASRHAHDALGKFFVKKSGGPTAEEYAHLVVKRATDENNPNYRGNQ